MQALLRHAAEPALQALARSCGKALAGTAPGQHAACSVVLRQFSSSGDATASGSPDGEAHPGSGPARERCACNTPSSERQKSWQIWWLSTACSPSFWLTGVCERGDLQEDRDRLRHMHLERHAPICNFCCCATRRRARGDAAAAAGQRDRRQARQYPAQAWPAVPPRHPPLCGWPGLAAAAGPASVHPGGGTASWRRRRRAALSAAGPREAGVCMKRRTRTMRRQPAANGRLVASHVHDNCCTLLLPPHRASSRQRGLNCMPLEAAAACCSVLKPVLSALCELTFPSWPAAPCSSKYSTVHQNLQD